MLNKIAYYLEHEDERKQIAHNGQEKVCKEYTYDIHLKEMLIWYLIILIRFDEICLLRKTRNVRAT